MTEGGRVVEWSGTFDAGVADCGPLASEDMFLPDIDTDGDGVFDTDGDGVFDTVVTHGGGGAGTVVWSDVDADGHLDRVTEIDADGDYVAWVLTSDSENPADESWRATERGSL